MIIVLLYLYKLKLLSRLENKNEIPLRVNYEIWIHFEISILEVEIVLDLKNNLSWKKNVKSENFRLGMGEWCCRDCGYEI